MSYITRNLKQKAVYWGSPVRGGFGSFTFADPVEISVRWEEKTEIFIDLNGAQAISAALVYVSVDVVNQGYLWLGELSEISSSEEGAPHFVTNARQIRGVQKISNLKGTSFERKAWL